MKIPSHRTRNRLTLEQFREAKQQYGIREIPKVLGVGKNHVQFLSALDKGKFDHVTKNIFEQDYQSGMELVEIANKYHIPRDYIGFLREHLDIGRLGATFIHRKQTEKPLTQRQKAVVFGTLMGDACRMSPSSLKIKQSVKQREYALWKMSELHEHVSINSLKEEGYFDKRYGKTYEHITFYTNANTDIENINRMFYPDGSKVVTQETLDSLTPLSVAVWFMDDGTTDFRDKQRSTGINARPMSKICTDSFTKNEIDLICQWFMDRWGIIAVPSKREDRWRVFFSTTETPKLFDLIRPYIIPSMMYKLGEGLP